MITVKQLRPEGDNWIKAAEFNFVINGKKPSATTGNMYVPNNYPEDKFILRYFGESNAYTTND